MANVFHVQSFNMRGFNNSLEYVRTIINDNCPEIICLQETWHLKEDHQKFGRICDDYLFVEESGVESGTKIISGRLYGGQAILFKKCIGGNVTKLDFKNRRILGIHIKGNGEHNDLVIITVYMPCDNRRADTVNEEYNEVLNQLEVLSAQYDGARFVICGDWNTDPDRHNAQTNVFNDFLTRNNLNICWESRNATRGYTYFDYSNGHRSCLDHFALSGAVFESMLSCKVHDCPTNPSDHHNVGLTFTWDIQSQVTSERSHSDSRYAWHRVNSSDINKYKSMVDRLTDDIVLPRDSLYCKDIHCSHIGHKENLDKLCNDLINIVLECGDKCFPKVKPSIKRKSGGNIPGWNDETKSLREDSLFWHAIWVSCGRPPAGALASVMRHTRAKYHRAIKLLKRDADRMRRTRLAESFNQGPKRDFWMELKKMSKANRQTVNQLDGMCSDEDIAEHLSNKYRQLFSSAPTNQEDYDTLFKNLNENLQSEPQVYSINVSEVEKAIQCLNHDKSDGDRGTCSNHFIYAPHRFIVIMTSMLNSMIMHGHSPNDLLNAMLISIPKNLRGNMLTSDNYRGIALCSAITKIVDYVLLCKHSDIFQTSDLQFAFKENHSTTMCTSVITEVISYYNARDSNVYACLLDASKAFDRLNHGKLFSLLVERNLPAIVIRFLIDSYTRQVTYVQWNSARSSAIPMLNGVKQGGVLSPILFCVYMDELIGRLEKSGLGCHIGKQFLGGFGYADDLKVLCPSVGGLQKMINICEKFGQEFDVMFNAKKTVGICYGNISTPTIRHVYLNGVPIKWENSVKYLGNILSQNLSDAADIRLKKGSFITAVNKLNYVFKGIDSFTRIKLFQTYCTAWYGCQSWQLGTTDANALDIEWRKAVRRTLGLPAMTRSMLLPGLAGSRPFYQQHCDRINKFLNSMLQSKNVTVKYIATRAQTNTFGAMGRNFAYLKLISKSDQIDSAKQTYIDARIAQISELIRLRDGSDQIDVLDQDELQDILVHVCTDAI